MACGLRLLYRIALRADGVTVLRSFEAALRRRQAEFEGGGARASSPIAPKWAGVRHGSASEGQSSASHGRYQSANRTRRASGQFASGAYMKFPEYNIWKMLPGLSGRPPKSSCQLSKPYC
jgi:hypothetical protein